MTNNNWIRSISKSYIQLNEAQDDRPVNDWNAGGGSAAFFDALGKKMERVGLVAFSMIPSEHIKRHGSPFNPDGSLNPNHKIVRDEIETARRILTNRDASHRNASDEQILSHISIIPRTGYNGVETGDFNVHIHSTPQTPKLQENRIFNYLNEVNQAKSSQVEDERGIGRISRIGKPPKDSDRAVLFATGAAHAQQGLPPHPQGVNDPHYMDGYKSIASPNLNEARKMKPTSTDKKRNREIERAARVAHRIAANAISSIPGAKVVEKYPGQPFYGDEDPEHLSVVAHLGAVAPAVTDPVQAIRLVAKKHGVDPEAAIAAISTDDPMMARIKLESINNNMNNNNKSWVRQLSESYIRHSLNENSDIHKMIVDFLADRATQYPHITDPKTRRPDREASAAHIREILNATGPHTDADAAVEAIRPHAIDGNYSLESRIYDEGDYGFDVSEHPHYEQIVMDNEENFAERLAGELHRHITGK